MVALVRSMVMDEAGCRDAGMAGLSHDIGKALVPLDILNKAGKLTEMEFEKIKSHSERGYDSLFKGRAASAAVLDVCLHHREKTDGSGYPHRLRGEAISLLARMGAVCDVYDAITSNRPYTADWDPIVGREARDKWDSALSDELWAGDMALQSRLEPSAP